MAGTRDRILTATIELFRRHGFHGTSLKQVSVAARAPIGSLYHFFPDGKDDLAASAVAVAGASYQQLFEAIADAASGAGAAVTDFFEGAAAVLVETGYLDICPIGTIAGETASSNDTVRAATSRVFDSWVDAMATRLVAAGLPPLEADELATMIVAALEGSFILARAARSPEPVLATGRLVRRLVDAELASRLTGRPRRVRAH